MAKVGGYATDVLQSENKKGYNCPIKQLSSERKNVIITPHIGGCTYDAMRKTEAIIADYVRTVL